MPVSDTHLQTRPLPESKVSHVGTASVVVRIKAEPGDPLSLVASPIEYRLGADRGMVRLRR
jgi:hypothetical protein